MFASERYDSASGQVCWFCEQVTLLNAKVCKEFCVFAHINSLFWLDPVVGVLGEYTVCAEKATLRKKQIEIVQYGVLKEFPVYHTQKVAFHANYLIITV